MELAVRSEALFEGLNADERRRLFFLLSITDQLELREALAWAKQIEAFITGNTISPTDLPNAGLSFSPAIANNKKLGPEVLDSKVAVGNAVDQAARTSETAQEGEMVSNESSHTNSTASPAVVVTSRPALDKSSQIEFFKAMAKGATNAELAEHFGLTKRQAHALRIGMKRRTRSHNSTPTGAKPPLAATENALLGQIEADVVRFLRQIGDVVVKEGDLFAINSMLRLNFQELVTRANSKRLQRGKPTFDLPKQNGQNPAPFTNANGTARDT